MGIDPVSLAVTVALNAASMALTASQEFEGPRLDSLEITNSDYGAALQYFVGTRMLRGLSVIFAENLREEKRQNKTKGGKYNEYRYYGTFAVMVADHEIDKVLQVWFDEHLVYDATGVGPISPFTLTKRSSITDFMRIYTGTSAQEPDPRMLATVEAEHGAGTCPAFRGVAYIMFEELPLEKLGNRLPQVKVLATRNGANAFPYETSASPIDQPNQLWGFTYSPDGSRLIYGDAGNYAIWDVAARSLMISGTFPVSVMTSQQVFGWDREGYIYVAGDEETVGGDIHVLGPDGTTLVETLSMSGMSLGAESCTVKSLGDLYPEFLVCYPPSTTEVFAWKRLGNPTINFVDTSTIVGTGFTVTGSFVDSNGDLWVAGVKQPGSQTSMYFLRLTANGAELGAPTLVTVTGLPAATTPDVYALEYDGKFIISWNSTGLYQIDPADGSIDDSYVFNSDVFNTGRQFENHIPGASKLWLNVSDEAREINLADLSLVRAVDTGDWSGAGQADGIIYDPLTHALITAPPLSDQELTWRFLDRATSGGVVLQDVIELVSEMAGLDVAEDIDASAMNQTLTGFSWTQGTGRAILEPLLEGFSSLVRPHDFEIQFIKRGGASSGTISVTDMRAGSGRASGERYKVTRTLDTDLPRRAWLTHADPSIDQQPNTVPAQRNAASVDGAREMSLDLTTLAVTGAEARSMVDAWHRRTWFNAETYELATSRKYSALEPGDHRVLDLDTHGKTGELTSIIFRADGVLETRWRRDGPTVHVAPAQPAQPADGITPGVIAVFGLSKGFALDIPLVQDVDNNTNPILYVGAAPYSDDMLFPGAVVYRSDDGSDYSTEFAGVAAADVLTWGYANGALASALYTVWDRVSTVSVTVKNGTLTSASEAAIDANPMLNQALLGNEILQFATATLVSSDTSGKVYTLSGFKRGRRGTEGFVATHATGEQFILLDQVLDEEMGASDIGDTVYFKAVTNGRDLASAVPSTVVFAANSHKPYAPANFQAVKNPSTGDWVFTWRRRSRIGYRWTGASTVPLGEASEAYEVDIYNGASVVRTISVSTQTATYTNAQQVTDFGSGQATVTAHVRQIGDLVDGRETVGSF